MADVRKVPQQVVRDGLAAVYGAGLTTTDVFTIHNDGRVVLHFKKTGAGICNVTIATPGQVDGQPVADRVVPVPATTGDKLIGPFSEKDYNDSAGDLRVTLSEVTGLSLAVLRI